MKKNKILVTGAAGYIGGTFAYEALCKGFEVLGIDNFINSDDTNIQLLKEKFPSRFQFAELNLADDPKGLKKVLKRFNPNFVLHFAGLKAVEESQKKPELYKKNNVGSTLNLLENMAPSSSLIFSSSATVYGANQQQPLSEDSPIQASSVYGLTKIESENLIQRYALTKDIKAICLRYFNPIGSHRDYLIVEDYLNNPNNIMPKLIKAGKSNNNKIYVYGSDYNTKDGTGERDYIHITDLVQGHIAAMQKVDNIQNTQFFNLGTGKSTSVLQLIETFNRVNNLNIEIEYMERRKGDVPICYANPFKANKELNWKANICLEQMCKDSWEATNA